jgi:rubrerythrin
MKGSTLKLTQRYYRMEFIGTGVYEQLAKKVANSKPDLSKRLLKVANDERKHGKMFSKFYQKQFNRKAGQKRWIFLGKLAGLFFALQPIEKSILKLSNAEQDAVNKLNHVFESNQFAGDPFLKCLKAIYKDEVDHSKVYAEFF